MISRNLVNINSCNGSVPSGRSHYLNQCWLANDILLLYPQLQRNWNGGILVSRRPSVCPSVHPSVRLWTKPCPLCIFHNTSRIHFIFAHVIKQLQRVCRVQGLLQNSKIWNFGKFLEFVSQNACVLVVLVLWKWSEQLQSFLWWTQSAGIILCMRPANERRRCTVTASLIGWAHTQHDLCMGKGEDHHRGHLWMRWSNVWHCSNTGLSGLKYSAVPL